MRLNAVVGLREEQEWVEEDVKYPWPAEEKSCFQYASDILPENDWNSYLMGLSFFDGKWVKWSRWMEPLIKWFR